MPRTASAPAGGRGCDRGALVISLDFELHWGVRDHAPVNGPYRANLLGERCAIPALLALFQEFEIAATWATVGFLFARSREELECCSPVLRPAYRDPRLDPYREALGQGEDDDPLHFAPSLVEMLARAPHQEVATHTFSHYYCLEPGQSEAAFAADLASAVRIAAARGVALRSIVFPRNQHNPAYDDVLRRAGIICFRGAQQGWMYDPVAEAGNTRRVRLARMTDTYVRLAPHESVPWPRVAHGERLCNIPGSRFLRPYRPGLRALDSVRLRRIVSGLQRAAERAEVFHLWWHPHNFGTHLDENLAFLRQVLERFAELRHGYGMQSLTMADAAALALAAAERG